MASDVCCIINQTPKIRTLGADHISITTLLTGLLPGCYFKNGVRIPEPREAGLFIQRPDDAQYYKVVSDDPDVMLFQTGQYSQLGTNGRMKATKHFVEKAEDLEIERFTMALFVNADNEATIRSEDVLAQDFRYLHRFNDKGEIVKREDGLCRFLDWHLLSLNQYEAKA